MSKEKDLKLAKQYYEEGKELQENAKYENSIEALNKASLLYEKWKIWEKWVQTNNELGQNYFFLGKYKQGVMYLQVTLKKGRTQLGNEHLHVATSLQHLASCYWAKEDYDLAIRFDKEALAIRKKTLGRNHPLVAISLNNLGVSHVSKGDYQLAIDFCKEALVIRKKTLGKNHLHVAKSLNNLGICYEQTGDYDLALGFLKEALAIKKRLSKQNSFITSTLNNIGNCYEAKKEYDLAIGFYQETLVIDKKKLGKNHPYIADTLFNIGNCHISKKEPDLALVFLKEALAICKKKMVKEHSGVARILDNMAICYYLKENYGLSIRFHQEALAIRKKGLDENHPRLAISFINIGVCYKKIRNYAIAINYFQKALIVLTQSSSQENIFQNPNLKFYSRGDYFWEALEEKAQALFGYYTFQGQNLKYLQAALSTNQLTTDLITDLRQSYKAEGSKHTLAERATKTYNLAIRITLKTAEVYKTLPSIPQHPEFTNIPYTTEGCKNLAFDFTEQSKAILLLSSLKDSEAKTAANIPKDLLEKEKQLKIELNYFDKSIATQEAKGDQKDEELLSKFQSQYFDYKQQYDQLIEQFEADYPEYYRLKYAVETASVEEVQEYLRSVSININSEGFKPLAIDIDEATLISYHIAEEKIYIFTITSNDYQIHTLEKPSNFAQLITNFQDAIALGDIDEYMDSASILFDLLLLPALKSIPNTSKLIIIPHNELTTLSFDALIDTRKLEEKERAKISMECDFSALPYLIKDYDISYHYSATMLLHSVARQKQAAPKPANFVGFAPVNFDGSENTQLALASNKGQTKVMRSNRAGQKALAKLPSTENEVKEIFQLFEAKELEAKAFLYASANKQNLFDNAPKHKYVLIATHGYAQDGNANLSGIYLARGQETGVRGQETGVRGQETGVRSEESENRQESKAKTIETHEDTNTRTHKHPNTNYLLHTSEAYHLQLDADLVVLSSCNSGVGKLVTGEGMMAINRGFLYAGASNIIFTHFDIPDGSSGELVKVLFEEILEGKDYASALRKAKLEVIRQDLKTPEDWAGYALIGV